MYVNPEFFTAKEVHETLLDARKDFRSDAELARAIGVSRSHFSRVMRKEKPIDGKVLRWLGFRRVVAYQDRAA